MVTTNDSQYEGTGGITISTNGDLPKYGSGNQIGLNIKFPVSGTYYIYTKTLTPQSGQGITLHSAGIYEYSASATTPTLYFTTNNLVNTETVKVALADNTLANVPSVSYIVKNQAITGQLTCSGGFPTTPFAYIEDASNNRVGVISLSSISGNTCNYSLTLRSYYNLTLNSGVNVYVTDGNGNLRHFTATIKGLIDSADRSFE